MGVRKAHLVGIGGTGMGSLAGLLLASGWEVRGSDTGVYPPMSEQLATLGIQVMDGFAAPHLDWGPDLVVVGNIARPDNPEAVEAKRRGLAVTSMSAALAAHFLTGRLPVVVAGTHGKTTTSSLIAWVLHHAGRDPGFLIGGVVGGLETTYRLGRGQPFVVEGDEYETAYFDRGPKFLHYQPRHGVLTSVELDHVEVYPDLKALEAAFARFVALIPGDGRLAVCADDPLALATAARCGGEVITYGLDAGAGTRAQPLEAGPGGCRFRIQRRGRLFGEFHSPLTGRHNLRNLAAAVEILAGLDLTAEEIGSALARFAGVRRRQEVRGVVGGVTVIDDFAHHPTAVRETLAALRDRFPGRRLVAVFEPRTNTSRRSLFQQAYLEALTAADRVVVAAVDHPERAPDGDRLDPAALVAGLRREGVASEFIPQVEGIVEDLANRSEPGDVVAVMSNGAFGGLHARLLEALAARFPEPPGPPARDGQAAPPG